MLNIDTKIEVPDTEADEPTADFYWICRHSISGMVVLFTGLCEGVVLHSGKTGFPVGHYSGVWVAATFAGWVRLPRGTKVTIELKS